MLEGSHQFEKDHAHTIHDYNLKSSDLILIRNTVIEKALNWKMQACYLGPLIVISCNKGGAYIIAELNGSVFDRPVAAFRIIPYFARTSIVIPPLDELLNISWSRLIQMEQSTLEDLWCFSFFLYWFSDYYSLLRLQSHFCLGISCITVKELCSPSGLGQWR